jgi:glycine reductase
MSRKMVHYLNQFFGGIGSESMADIPPRIVKGTVGPGTLLQKQLGDDIEIVATIICGDNYISQYTDDALSQIKDMISESGADMLFAGPSFESGRYGLACGEVCRMATDVLKMDNCVVMSKKNPACEEFSNSTYIVPGSDAAGKMRKDIKTATVFIKKLLGEEGLKSAREEGYISRGFRRNIVKKDIGATRAVDMLLAKMKGEEFETEIPLPKYSRVEATRLVKPLNEMKIAFVSTGGIVRKNNPDKIESVRATKWKKYPIDEIKGLTSDDFQSVHGGYENLHANQDPNRVVPVDALLELERNGIIGEVDRSFYAFCGAMGVLDTAIALTGEMIEDMRQNHVDGVILTST